jgi:hypothetical protein
MRDGGIGTMEDWNEGIVLVLLLELVLGKMEV